MERVIADGRTAGGLPLKPSRDRDRYRYATLADGERRWRVHIARLVLLAHAEPPPQPGMEVLHRNGRRGDNRLANLRWGTRAENRQDRERHRRERAAQRAARAGVREEKERETGEEGTDEKERETSEIGKQSPSRLTAVSGVSWG